MSADAMNSMISIELENSPLYWWHHEQIFHRCLYPAEFGPRYRPERGDNLAAGARGAQSRCRLHPDAGEHHLNRAEPREGAGSRPWRGGPPGDPCIPVPGGGDRRLVADRLAY